MCSRLWSPRASVQAALGGRGPLGSYSTPIAPQPPQIPEGLPGWRKGPSEAVRVLDSACLGAYSPGLSKVYRLMGGASQHSPGAQISCVHHFLAAWPR